MKFHSAVNESSSSKKSFELCGNDPKTSDSLVRMLYIFHHLNNCTKEQVRNWLNHRWHPFNPAMVAKDLASDTFMQTRWITADHLHSSIYLISDGWIFSSIQNLRKTLTNRLQRKINDSPSAPEAFKKEPPVDLRGIASDLQDKALDSIFGSINK